MATPTDLVTLNITYSVSKQTLSIDGNATPPELMQIVAQLTAQMAKVFADLDREIRKAREEQSSIIVPHGAGQLITPRMN